MRRGVDPVNGKASPLLGIVAGILLSFVVPVVVLANTGRGLEQPGPWWAMGLMVLAGARYAWLFGTGSVRLFEMSTWLFTYIFMGLAPLVQRRNDAVLDTTPDVNFALATTAALVVALGSGAIMLGSMLAGGQRHRAPVSATAEVSPVRLRLLAVASWGFSLYYLKKLGGVGWLFKSRFDVADQVANNFSQAFVATLIGGLGDMSTLVSAVALLLRLRSLRGQRVPKVDYVLTVVQVGLTLILINPISSPRYVFGTAFLALIAAAGGMDTLRRFRWVCLGALFAFLVVFPLLDAFRVSTDATVGPVNPFAALESGDFDAFNETINTVDYVHQLGSTHGLQLLGVLLFFVPRSLWPAKPVDTGILLARFKGYKFENLSAPFWAEMYINGGWIFLVISLLLLGYVLRSADGVLKARLAARQPLPVLACILPFYLLILWRGSLLQAVANLSVIAMAYLAIREYHPTALQS